MFLFCGSDPDPGGLERRAVQRHGLHHSAGRALLRASHDVRKLRPLQPAGGHLGGGLPGGGIRADFLRLMCECLVPVVRKGTAGGALDLVVEIGSFTTTE